jgi:hypothetical protein
VPTDWFFYGFIFSEGLAIGNCKDNSGNEIGHEIGYLSFIIFFYSKVIFAKNRVANQTYYETFKISNLHCIIRNIFNSVLFDEF